MNSTHPQPNQPVALPYLTSDTPGIGGVIKQRPEDFIVTEIPLYEPSGEGEHVYAEVQKVGLTTFDAVNRLADALGVSSREIGFAGMKDAHAVTRQTFSILGTDPEAVRALEIPGMQVLWATRHGNKLRLGHLMGNRFVIKVRDVEPTSAVRVVPVLKRLEATGMPNYFGEQRFGMRQNNDLLGAALVRGDNRAVLQLLLGDPRPTDPPHVKAARQAFMEGENDKAMHLWPRRHGLERRVLHRLIKTRKMGTAVRAIDEKLRKLWVSALQSRVFNEVVAARIATLGTVLDGDWAYKHDNGACFHVENATAEQPRAQEFEISPTGPLVGYRLSVTTGEPGEIEQAVLQKFDLKPADFKVHGRLRVKGARRPLRIKPSDVETNSGVDEHGAFVTLAFTLPAGSFATVLLREVMKSEQASREDQDPNPDAQAASGDAESAAHPLGVTAGIDDLDADDLSSDSDPGEALDDDGDLDGR